MREIYQIIDDCPGIGPSDIAKGMGISDAVVRNTLITMNKHGFLLSEGSFGDLYTFDLARANLNLGVGIWQR